MPSNPDDSPALGVLTRGLRWSVKGLLLIAAVLSAILAVASAVIFVTDRYNDKFRWRQREYTKLSGLHAGYTRERFKAVLGTPVFSRKAPRTGLREDSFRRRDYWVQAVSRADGTVLLYAVTSCDPEFRPAFDIPATGGRLVLRKSRLATVVPANLDQSVEINYSTGNTINATYIDEFYAANPGYYQTFAWGVNDACQVVTADTPSLTGRFHGPVTEGGPSIRRFRRQAIVNTYAETAAAESLARLNRSYQTGVDRILTRTVDRRG